MFALLVLSEIHLFAQKGLDVCDYDKGRGIKLAVGLGQKRI